MTDDEKIRIANLEFFDSLMLRPVLALYAKSPSPNDTAIVPALCVVEAAIWMQLGVAIKFFDGAQALEILRQSSSRLLTAWSELVQKQVVGRVDAWCDFISAEGTPILDRQQFLRAGNPYFEQPESLHSTFENYVVLTAKAITDKNARYLLENIGWTPEDEWERLKRGLGSQDAGSVESLYAGFASALNYLEAMRDSRPPFFDVPMENPLLEPEELLKRVALETQFWSFSSAARSILSKRFNLGQTGVAERYFKFSGELVEEQRQSGPAWLEMRRSTFHKILSLMVYAGAKIQKGDFQGLFDIYIHEPQSYNQQINWERPHSTTEEA